MRFGLLAQTAGGPTLRKVPVLKKLKWWKGHFESGKERNGVRGHFEGGKR